MTGDEIAMRDEAMTNLQCVLDHIDDKQYETNMISVYKYISEALEYLTLM